MLGGTGSVLVTTKTDVAGNYAFSNLAAGTYWVRFGLPSGFAFSAANQGLDDRYDSDADPNGLTSAIVLAADEVDLTWDAGVYRIEVEPQVVTPAPPGSVAATEETLPFTGSSDGTRAGLAFSLAALGGLVLLAARRREEEAVVVEDDWYDRLRHYDLRY